MRLLFSVPVPNAKGGPSAAGYRYFVDLKNGAFIYVFPERLCPPEGWPLVEINASEVEELLLKEDD